jgi:hypothetical protein
MGQQGNVRRALRAIWDYALVFARLALALFVAVPIILVDDWWTGRKRRKRGG